MVAKSGELVSFLGRNDCISLVAYVLTSAGLAVNCGCCLAVAAETTN
jgi:hypothetical protein